MGSGLAITYIIDSHKDLAGESIVTVILIRNTIGKRELSLRIDQSVPSALKILRLALLSHMQSIL